MANSSLVTDVKRDLGINHNKKDEEINSAIQAAKLELTRVGVEVADDSNALTSTAIKLWCRSWFNYQGEAERYMAAFEKLRDSMSMSGMFRAPWGAEDENE